MDQDFLQQFRQQLATWTEKLLATHKLPFQRLELCPGILTEAGHFSPDIVLWINRDSQLAGSMILLPDVIDQDVLKKATALSKALGLGHFTTWAAKDVCIWRVDDAGEEVIRRFTLPSVDQIQPEDFEWTLERLLDELKVVTITTAPTKNSYSLYYFANLCLHNLQEMSPGLIESARATGGQKAADEWVRHAPAEKAWLSLWRTLFLLWAKRLPPGLQPNRLEQVFHYAIADLDASENLRNQISLAPAEPPLTEVDAVRLHHLAGRMSQLDWPADMGSAIALINLLLAETASRYDMAPAPAAQENSKTTILVNSEVPMGCLSDAIVAPRAYLAGTAIKALFSGKHNSTLAENLLALSTAENYDQAFASLMNNEIPGRKEKDARRLLLRKAWPNRRFNLSHKSPSWVYDTLYLAGVVNEKLSITLPRGWQAAHGVNTLWDVLKNSYRLNELSLQKAKGQTLLFSRISASTVKTQVHREDFTFELQGDCLAYAPAATRFWLLASRQIIEYLLERPLADREMQWCEAEEWGAYLFLHTQLGKYVWGLCTGQSALPELAGTLAAIQKYGIPVPDEMALTDLSLSGSRIDRQLPSEDILEQDFCAIWGAYPDLPEPGEQLEQQPPKAKRRTRNIIDRITHDVFFDGIPRFPEHYLMDSYKPEVASYDLEGPLEYAEEFFDKISLKSLNGKKSLHISGKNLADALILSSWSGQKNVALPRDPNLLDEIVQKYRMDLKDLWDQLTRECRKVEPQRQAAVKMAKRIWSQQRLPPAHLL